MLDQIQKNLLQEVSELDSLPAGAYQALIFISDPESKTKVYISR